MTYTIHRCEDHTIDVASCGTNDLEITINGGRATYYGDIFINDWDMEIEIEDSEAIEIARDMVDSAELIEILEEREEMPEPAKMTVSEAILFLRENGLTPVNPEELTLFVPSLLAKNAESDKPVSLEAWVRMYFNTLEGGAR